MPRPRRPQRQRVMLFDAGSPDPCERLRERLAELGQDPDTSPLLAALWNGHPATGWHDSEIDELTRACLAADKEG